MTLDLNPQDAARAELILNQQDAFYQYVALRDSKGAGHEETKKARQAYNDATVALAAFDKLTGIR